MFCVIQQCVFIDTTTLDTCHKPNSIEIQMSTLFIICLLWHHGTSLGSATAATHAFVPITSLQVAHNKTLLKYLTRTIPDRIPKLAPTTNTDSPCPAETRHGVEN